MRAAIIALALGLTAPLAAWAAPSPIGVAIDDAAHRWLATTGAPSVSVAVVKDGRIVYEKAYGAARLFPLQHPTIQTRYAIDSVSKQFTAAALLSLQEGGRLNIDDKVAKYFPDLTGARDITIKQLLSHTAGYRDYWPQDFNPPEMTRPTTTTAILNEWGRRPLDFKPGMDWQYSNTGFVIAGAIAEKVSGEPLMALLESRIFRPLHMNDVIEHDTATPRTTDAAGYTRYGEGPIRPAPKEAAGWLFAASGLAMTPHDLALWDISLIDRSLLHRNSYDALYKPTMLANGRNTHYSLGLNVVTDRGRSSIGHDGGGSGFLAANRLWPGDKIAIVALTNNDWARPASLVDRIAFLVLKPDAAETRALAVFADFQRGAVNRNLFTANGNFFLTPAVLADYQAGLAPLGRPLQLTLSSEILRGGMRTRNWKMTTAKGAVDVIERGFPDGKLEEFTVSAAQ